ncbi:hypothetical protein PSTG_10038 [Puccinia striiformis f. sp. tritici PST-78]|uniref:Uncharacterized protein n=1 Tax=Puccinia striiformis f. sp. tritici PST-78 TaxID=1165861 RepID=A0A0L0VBQ4_9BASI|nr:hypothetical protein PSTG_10038 [Puccinia striiformis f. sp. tritici PST-78]
MTYLGIPAPDNTLGYKACGCGQPSTPLTGALMATPPAVRKLPQRAGEAPGCREAILKIWRSFRLSGQPPEELEELQALGTALGELEELHALGTASQGAPCSWDSFPRSSMLSEQLPKELHALGTASQGAPCSRDSFPRSWRSSMLSGQLPEDLEKLQAVRTASRRAGTSWSFTAFQRAH